MIKNLKNLKELKDFPRNEDDLKKLLKANSKLQDKVQQYYSDGMVFYADEILSEFKGLLNDYRIDPYSYSFIEPYDAEEFIETLKEVNKSYAILSEDEVKLLNKTILNFEIIYNVSYDDYLDDDKRENINKLEDEVDEDVRELCDILTKYLCEMLEDIPYKQLEEVFLDYGLTEIGLDINDYYYDIDTYIIYEYNLISYE